MSFLRSDWKGKCLGLLMICMKHEDLLGIVTNWESGCGRVSLAVCCVSCVVPIRMINARLCDLAVPSPPTNHNRSIFFLERC